MAINFPDSPSVNDTFTSGEITFTWNGSVWNSSVDRTFTVGRRSGSAFTVNLTGSSFNVIGRSGNISINL